MTKTKYIFLIAVGIVISVLIGYKFGTYRTRKGLAASESSIRQTDSVLVNGWASEDECNYWKKAIFTIPEYDGIPLAFQRAIVKIFIDNKYVTTNEYFLTKIKDRA